jgi:ABC-type multidrug transport system ATPase subunit
LGHNGAGKTTTTFLLCGIYPPTSGTAYIMNHDLRTDLDHIRSALGYCPQQDILFDNFTVKEHLKLISLVNILFKKINHKELSININFKIKGFPSEKIKSEINRIAGFVGLENDLMKKAKNLSGGMKRRLLKMKFQFFFQR